LPTDIKIAVDNVNLNLPLLQEPVKKPLLKLKGHFGFFDGCSVEII
jgi:hypothetical protein